MRREEVHADRWVAEGTIKVTRDVDALEVEVAGLVSVGGRVVAGSFRARGTLEVEGPVDVRDRADLRGNVRLGGAVHAGDLSFTAAARLAAPLVVDRTLTVRGALQAPSVSAGVIDWDGSATVPGEVRALSANFLLRRSSSLGLVRARSVVLHGKVPNLVDKVFFREPTHRVGRIEADSVVLEGVDVAFVRSRAIVLRREAHVTEYEGTIVARHPSSSVGPESKSPPPYGLRR